MSRRPRTRPAHFTREHVDGEIAQHWASNARRFQIDPAPEYGVRDLIEGIGADCSEDVHLLEPWLSIVELGIYHLAGLARSLSEQRRTIWRLPGALVGTACAHAVALRNSMVHGLDASARVLLRTFSDSLSLAVLIVADKDLDSAYRLVATPDDARIFWQRQMGYRRLNERLRAVESALGFPAELLDVFQAARLDMLKLHSGYVHSAPIPSYLTNMVPSLRDGGILRAGLLGHVSVGSLQTADDFIQTLWYHSHMLLKVMLSGPLGSYPIYKWRPKCLSDQIAWIGHHVFGKVALEHWDDIVQWDPVRAAGHA